MRVRELVMLAALAGCTTNPDPREPSIEMMQRQGYGAFIVLSAATGQQVTGELISAEREVVRVLEFGAEGSGDLTAVPYTQVSKAQLFKYKAQGGYGAWSVFGIASTISHGFLLVLSAPVWMISGGIATAAESNHVVMEWPGDSWRQISHWARFPQGMPPGLDAQALRYPMPPPPPPPPVPPPPPPGPSADQIRIAKRQQAWELTKQASDASRRGDCAIVLTLAEQVKALDPTFYDAPFSIDVGIRACLSATTAP